MKENGGGGGARPRNRIDDVITLRSYHKSSACVCVIQSLNRSG